MIQDYFSPGYVIKRPTTVNDGGLINQSFQVVTTISGKMRQLSGAEILVNEKRNYVTTHRFYCDVIGIQNGDFISKGGKDYEVKVVTNPMELGEYLMVDCEYKAESAAIESIISNENVVVS